MACVHLPASVRLTLLRGVGVSEDSSVPRGLREPQEPPTPGALKEALGPHTRGGGARGQSGRVCGSSWAGWAPWGVGNGARLHLQRPGRSKVPSTGAARPPPSPPPPPPGGWSRARGDEMDGLPRPSEQRGPVGREPGYPGGPHLLTRDPQLGLASGVRSPAHKNVY